MPIAIVIVIAIIVINSMTKSGFFGYKKNYDDSYLDNSYISLTSKLESDPVGRMAIFKGTVIKKYDDIKDKSVKNKYLLKLTGLSTDFFIVSIRDDRELDIDSSYEIKGFIEGIAKTERYEDKDYTVPIVDMQSSEPICNEEVNNEASINKKPKYDQIFSKYINNNKEITITIDRLECYDDYSTVYYTLINADGKKVEVLDAHFSISFNDEIIEEKDVSVLKSQLKKDTSMAKEQIHIGKLKTIYGDKMMLTVNYKIDGEEKSSTLECVVDK